jgi:hypothetical protein
MKTEKPKSLEEFLLLFNSLNSPVDKYYRGQADYSWDITPGLARNKGIKNINEIIEIERRIIEKFKQNIKESKLEVLLPTVNGYEECWLILMIAQHCGLPTRLLDFSHDKIIALLFAVADIQYHNKDGALIIYENPTDKQKDLSIFRNRFVNNLDKSFFIQATILMNKDNNELRLSEIRKFLQGSKFFYRETQHLCDCLSKDTEHTNRFTKIQIPKEIKLDIIREIIRMREMVYDLFAGKNELDHFAAILKLEFSALDESKIDDYLKSDNLL